MGNCNGYRAKSIGISRWGPSRADVTTWGLRPRFSKTYEGIQEVTELLVHRWAPADIRSIPYLRVLRLRSCCLPTRQLRKSCRPISTAKRNSFRRLGSVLGHAKRTLF